MLRNRIGTDLNMRAVEGSAAQTDFFKQRGVYVAYVNRITTGQEQVVNKTFVKIMDELGHNIELAYINNTRVDQTTVHAVAILDAHTDPFGSAFATRRSE